MAASVERLRKAHLANASKITKSGRIAKRILDLAGSIFLLLLLLPVIAVIALLIKIEDGGPVIFRRRVIGKKGEFDALKLRSMYVDADKILERDGALLKEFEVSFKLKNDPRVTRIGAWTRKFSLDELPQLLNVLRGEMSLVGPRMITRPELEKYGDAGCQKCACICRPPNVACLFAARLSRGLGRVRRLFALRFVSLFAERLGRSGWTLQF